MRHGLAVREVTVHLSPLRSWRKDELSEVTYHTVTGKLSGRAWYVRSEIHGFRTRRLEMDRLGMEIIYADHKQKLAEPCLRWCI